MTHKRNILFLPFLQIPSGHHQAADAIIDELSEKHPDIKCDKVDILSYSYGKVEAFVSLTYLKWIQTIPQFYNWLYQSSVYKKGDFDKRYHLYELLFIPFMRKLLNEKKPDLIVCTHALPSYMINRLKEVHELHIPVINIYTDYFIHEFWGIKHIDFHFTSSHHMKEFLLHKGIKENQIVNTGIPIHQKLKNHSGSVGKSHHSLSLLITGGSLGIGAIGELIKRMGTHSMIDFFVLCGKNEQLYGKLKNSGRANIVPLRYIKCKDEMNKLYDQIDGIITKPGGVTISESLYKRKPIFIYHALPGQEVINLHQLKKLGLVYELNYWKRQTQPMDEFIYALYRNKSQWMEDHHQSISLYHQQLSTIGPVDFIEKVIFEK